MILASESRDNDSICHLVLPFQPGAGTLLAFSEMGSIVQ